MSIQLKSTLKGHSGNVSCLTRYNVLLVSGSSDKTIKLWDEKGECISTFNANDYIICFTVFKDMIISGDYKGMIQYWNTSSGRCIKSIQAYNDSHINSLTVINNLLYSCGDDDGNIMVWSEDGECIYTIKAHSNYVYCLIEYKGMLISGSWDSTIKCWSLSSSYDCINTLEGHSSGIRYLAVYDNYLLSGSLDRTMKLWGIDGRCIQTFEHEGYVISILVVDMFIIISGDSGGKMYIWSIEGNLLESVEAHSSYIMSLVIHQNHIYSCSDDYTIKKWSFSYLKMKRQALLALNVMRILKDVDDDMKLCLLLTFFLKRNNILSYSQLKKISDYTYSSDITPDFILTILRTHFFCMPFK